MPSPFMIGFKLPIDKRRRTKTRSRMLNMQYVVLLIDPFLALILMFHSMNCRYLGWGKARHILSAIKM